MLISCYRTKTRKTSLWKRNSLLAQTPQEGVTSSPLIFTDHKIKPPSLPALPPLLFFYWQKLTSRWRVKKLEASKEPQACARPRPRPSIHQRSSESNWFSFVKTISAKIQREPPQIASGQFNSTWRDMQVSNLVSLSDTLSILTPFKEGPVKTKLMVCSRLLICWISNNAVTSCFPVFCFSSLFPLVNCMHVCVWLLE